MTATLRSPAVSGIFYPERKEALRELLDHLVPSSKEKQNAIAAVIPHGSLFSCGAVAAAVYGALRPFGTAVIFGPNHSRLGERLSVAADGEWETPLGKLPVDRELARAIRKAVPELKKDSKSHQHEHAAEVQLPFLQHLWKARGFVPLCVAEMDAETAAGVGKGVARGLRQSKKEALLIASSNLACHQPPEPAQRLDRQMIERILALDGQGLMDLVAESAGPHQRAGPMCAAPAVAAVIAAAKELGASRASLVKYKQGYAGILFQ